MLKSIHIKGLAVVDSLQLELNQGMTVLTGETGAGKSILLTAMKLCLGERADTGLLRPGAEKADITLVFDIHKNSSSYKWLIDNDLEEEDCIIRRTINKDGRSRSYINGQAVNLKVMQAFASHLISIHGQHAHLELLQASKQRQLLDGASGESSKLHCCKQAYKQWKTLTDEYLKLTNGNIDNENEKQLLRYQLNELEQAGVEDLNYDALSTEHTRLSNMGKIIEIGQAQIEKLYENDHTSIHSQLSESLQELENLSELAPEFSEPTEQISEAVIQIQEASRELRNKLDQQESYPEELNIVDNKLILIHELSHKLHAEPYQLKDTFLKLSGQLNVLESSEERINELQADIETSKKAYFNIANELHSQRILKAQDLSQHITKTLKTLGLPDGQFTICVEKIQDTSPQPFGIDNIEFTVSTNPGHPDKALAKVASGGELSRISLAIQVVANSSKTTPTLVFDEVDAGIGGGVAETVGSNLRSLSVDKQVLCVTHLPQVASQGHQHLLISKSKKNSTTETHVNQLSNKQRVDEISRIRS
jgi:DNA repair protein RecN (Recombination protein N)